MNAVTLAVLVGLLCMVVLQFIESVPLLAREIHAKSGLEPKPYDGNTIHCSDIESNVETLFLKQSPPYREEDPHKGRSMPYTQLDDFKHISNLIFDRKWKSTKADFLNFKKKNLYQVFDSCIDVENNVLYLKSTGKEVGVTSTSFPAYPSLTVERVTRWSQVSLNKVRVPGHAYVLLQDSWGSNRIWDSMIPDLSSQSAGDDVKMSFSWFMHIVSIFTLDTLYRQPKYIVSKPALMIPDIVRFVNLTSSILSRTFSPHPSEIVFDTRPLCSYRLFLIPTAPHRTYRLPQWSSISLYRELIYLALDIPSAIESKQFFELLMDVSSKWISSLGNAMLLDKMFGSLGQKYHLRRISFADQSVKSLVHYLCDTDTLIMPLGYNVLYAMFMRPGSSIIMTVPEQYSLTAQISLLSSVLRNAFVSLYPHFLSSLENYVQIVSNNYPAPGMKSYICEEEKNKPWIALKNNSDSLYVHCCKLQGTILKVVNTTYYEYSLY